MTLADEITELVAVRHNMDITTGERVRAVFEIESFLNFNLPEIIAALHAAPRVAELEAENARLREALVRCEKVLGQTPALCDHARAALKGPTDGQ